MGNKNITPMEDQNKEDVLSDEQIAEQEKEAGAEGDVLRAKVVAELGLEDNDANKELIDKVVTREGGLRKGFGKLLGNYKKLKAKPANTPITPVVDKKQETALSPEDIRKEAGASTRETLNEEYLEESDHSDEIKQLIRDEAKRLGVSARKAEKSEFIQFKITKAKEAARIDEAANNGKHKGAKGSAIDSSKPLNPDDFDLSTEQGRSDWEKAKKERRPAK